MFVVYSDSHVKGMKSFPTLDTAKEDAVKAVKEHGCSFGVYELVQRHHEAPSPTDVNFRVTKQYVGWGIVIVMPTTDDTWRSFIAFADGGGFPVVQDVMCKVTDEALERFRKLAYRFGWVVQ